MTGADIVRLLLVGRPGGEFRLAAEMARDAGAEVTMADRPDDALALLRGASFSLVMIDVEADCVAFLVQLRAERFALPVLACGIDASAARAVAAIRAGARDYLPLPPDRSLIAAAILSVVARPPTRMIGSEPGFLRARSFAMAMAQARVPILITGEDGSGRETMARAIHDASGRSGDFLVVECAGVCAEVVESELFGHEAGAFPGAIAGRVGRLESAHEGTLFLRDIDALVPAAQARLQAVMKDDAGRQVGGSDAVPVSARIIASASCDLAACVDRGTFRSDLMARLALVRVSLPPLRERAVDIPLLAANFAEWLAIANDLPVRPIDDQALALLIAHSWPGNVRELEDVIHRAVLLAQDRTIRAENLVLTDGSRLVPPAVATTRADLQIDRLIGHTVEDVERELILGTLERCRGNRTYASNILGISVRTMRNKLKSFIEGGISVAPAS